MAACSTACTPLAHEDVDTRVRVKCILDKFGYAMYFSRGVLPQNKDGQVRAYPSPFQDRPYLLHLGLACFDRAFLAQYCKMPPTPLMVCSLDSLFDGLLIMPSVFTAGAPPEL